MLLNYFFIVIDRYFSRGCHKLEGRNDAGTPTNIALVAHKLRTAKHMKPSWFKTNRNNINQSEKDNIKMIPLYTNV
jgi:hypothetical protein